MISLHDFLIILINFGCDLLITIIGTYFMSIVFVRRHEKNKEKEYRKPAFYNQRIINENLKYKISYQGHDHLIIENVDLCFDDYPIPCKIEENESKIVYYGEIKEDYSVKLITKRKYKKREKKLKKQKKEIEKKAQGIEKLYFDENKTEYLEDVINYNDVLKRLGLRHFCDDFINLTPYRRSFLFENTILFEKNKLYKLYPSKNKQFECFVLTIMQIDYYYNRLTKSWLKKTLKWLETEMKNQFGLKAIKRWELETWEKVLGHKLYYINNFDFWVKYNMVY